VMAREESTKAVAEKRNFMMIELHKMLRED
jgi:hypothetical protein